MRTGAMMGEDEPRGRGRPSLYRPEYADQVGPFMAKGYSLTSFAAHCDVGRATITRWMDEHEDFRAACMRAQAHRAMWWEGRLMAIANGEGGPGASTAAIFGIKNAAPEDFREKQKDEDNHEITVNVRGGLRRHA